MVQTARDSRRASHGAGGQRVVSVTVLDSETVLTVFELAMVLVADVVVSVTVLDSEAVLTVIELVMVLWQTPWSA